MTRTTCHAFDPEVLGTGDNGDAIILSSDRGVEDHDVCVGSVFIKSKAVDLYIFMRNKI